MNNKGTSKTVKLKTSKISASTEEILADLQRTRADFENYRKNSEIEKQRLAKISKNSTLMKVIPIVDDIERATDHLPDDLKNNDWAKGVIALREKLLKDLADLGVTQINAKEGVLFDPNYHEAVQMDDEGGDQEMISEELRSGWMVDDEIVRPAMVRVVRK